MSKRMLDQRGGDRIQYAAKKLVEKYGWNKIEGISAKEIDKMVNEGKNRFKPVDKCI